MTDNSHLRIEQLGQLCRLLPLSIGSSVLVALVAASVLWGSTGHVVMLSWFAALCGCSVWRLAYWRSHRRLQSGGLDPGQPEAIQRVQRLGRGFRLSTLIAGIVWGSTALLLYTPANVVLQAFLAFVLAGVTAGSASSLAADRGAALSFQLPALLPLAARLLLQHDAVHLGMGFMVLFYAAFIVWSVRWMSVNITENIALRLQALHREQALHQSEARYRELALHDALTGLPNRRALQSALSLRLTQARDGGSSLALIYIDIDNFKDINDSRGHGCGDALLVELAQRLRRYADPEDLVARCGGDEFIFVRMGAGDAAAATAFVSRISTSVAQPWLFEGEPISVGASIGISLFPDDGADMDNLMERADIALYQAKARGRNNYQLFASDMSESRHERILLERALAEAISKEQLSAVYQPVVELPSGRVIALEAQACWHHAERGPVAPEIFVPIAEKCGLSDALAEQLLRLVCAQLRSWTNDMVPVVPVAIDVSPSQFDHGHIRQLIATVAAEFHVAPHLLQIEVTKGGLRRGAKHHRATLEALRAEGVRVYFGTGYSSLSYLTHMPIDGLKIDRNFVHDLDSGPCESAVIGAIVGIGGSLGIRVVAEGVESAQQAVQLAALGCNAAQGHYFHRPMSATRCSDLLREFGRQHSWTDTLRKRMLRWAGA